ncbi:MAG: L-threonylcarbamoyladenylate synthase [Planctomycetota bacterium]|nr:L-threonylcarbamoyladenylate synthase [Planctomycetota bacterium]
MALLRLSLDNDPEGAALAARNVLAGGGVVVFPTETVYGIGVMHGHPGALERLRRLKDREGTDAKPFQLLVDSLDMARSLGAMPPPEAERLARRFWPGPLTLIIPDAGGPVGVGIRVPDSPFVRGLCRRLGRAIVASSANPAGRPPPIGPDQADVFGEGVDLLVDGGPTAGGIPSTVAICLNGRLKIARPGGIGSADLLAAWRGQCSVTSHSLLETLRGVPPVRPVSASGDFSENSPSASEIGSGENGLRHPQD